MSGQPKATLGYEQRPNDDRGGLARRGVSPVTASPRATMSYADRSGGAAPVPSMSMTSTMLASASMVRPVAPVEFDDLGETMCASDASASIGASTPPGATLGATRTTVLPRRKRAPASEAGVEWHVDERPRFETLEVLGRGGMGEVALAKDNDIRRTVAVKRLHPEHQHAEAILRFADEVRAVGQLEHPGIVPIYDVGIDEGGQHYLVMKHVQGETLEAVIEKLQRGEPEYLARYTPEYRAHLFLEILQAIRYAHDRGILHRDIKPANIMVGPFGEVTIMDWGLAKKIARRSGDAPAAQPDAAVKLSGEIKLLETMHGALLGTPLYMSPEQAAGRNDDLDERSDVFALSMMFIEMVTLHHPLAKIQTVQEILATLIAKDLDNPRTMGDDIANSGAPIEFLQFAAKGLARDREKRFRSVEEMENVLRGILSGHIPVCCHISWTKNVAHRVLHWVDRHPIGFTMGLGATVVGAAGLVIGFGVWLVRSLV